MKGWEKIFHAKRNEKKARVAILTADNIDLKTQTALKEKEGHYIVIKGSN